MATKDLKCPNCGAAAVAKEGGGLVCPACGGTFTFQEGEARLTGVGEYDRLKGQVEKLEADQAAIRELLGKPEEIPEGRDLIGACDPPESDEDVDEEDDEEEDW